MMIMRYLLEYTLDVVCKGNRSECARRLGLEYTELKRIRKRMSEGAGSIRVTEAVLQMYWREGISIDNALTAYTQSYMGDDIEKADKLCCELTDSLRGIMKDQQRTKQELTMLIKAASEFLDQLQRSYCDGYCMRQRYDGIPCPVTRFSEYLNMLIEELSVEANSFQAESSI